jgi:hypothetical protein
MVKRLIVQVEMMDLLLEEDGSIKRQTFAIANQTQTWLPRNLTKYCIW